MKKCPYCAEEIQDAAIVCKHCSRELATAPVPPPPAAPPSKGQRFARLVLYAFLGFAGLVMLSALISMNESNEANAPAPSKVLAVSVAASGTELQITNQGSPAGIPITIYLNGTPPFTYRTDATMPPNGETVLRIPLLQFTKKDGERFNPYSHAVTTVWIGGNGYDYKQLTFQR